MVGEISHAFAVKDLLGKQFGKHTLDFKRVSCSTRSSGFHFHKAFLLVEKLKMIIGDFCLKETAHSEVAFLIPLSEISFL